MSRSLFTRAILQSASPLSPWALLPSKEAKRRSHQLAQKVGCPSEEKARDLLKCLQSVDPFKLVNAEWDPADGPIAYGVCAMPFVPIIDGQFLPENPLRMLQSGQFKKTEVLLGANKDEGSYFLIYYLTHLFRLEENVSDSQNYKHQNAKR